VTSPAPSEHTDLSNDVVRFEVVGRVGIVTLTRPESRNALHDDMHEPITRTVRAWADDPDIGCIVLTGEGTAFCAGGDVRVGSGRRSDGARPTFDERVEFLTSCAQLSVLLHESPIVTIAAVNGPAVGAGMALALACDLRIAAASARFVGGWAALGFSGDYGGAWLLRHRIGASAALEIVASNRTVAADEARRLGMIDRLVPDADFGEEWRAWAAAFAAGPQTAIRFMKANVADADRLTLAEAIEIESRRQIETGQTDDHREGVRAWIEKRPPVFGRTTVSRPRRSP
jgi:2-(1,2-epoxy-1,2-dihydrophenyl)acetyl-CoA isomerase